MDRNTFLAFITEILLDYWFSRNKEVEIKKNGCQVFFKMHINPNKTQQILPCLY